MRFLHKCLNYEYNQFNKITMHLNETANCWVVQCGFS